MGYFSRIFNKMENAFLFAVDVLIRNAALYKGQRIGLVTNDAATTAEGIQSRVAMQLAGLQLVKLFSPEHGIARIGADGVGQSDAIDLLTGLPIISLYGEKLAPTAADLNDLDLLLFDVPDIGCRFYTYLWTMTHTMEAAAKCNIKLLILDRPNPIGANLSQTEGPWLDELRCSSFIGRWNIPIRHCTTLGELALYFAAEKISSCPVEVIKMEGYHRHFNAVKHFKFVPTSPAMPSTQTAFLYPGMGLLEGVNVSEGRGTDFPFMRIGAPWINKEVFINAISAKGEIAIDCKACQFIPTEGLYKGVNCFGMDIEIKDIDLLRPVELGILIITTLFQLYPQQLKERLYPTAANPSGSGHLDKLLGINQAFKSICEQKNIEVSISADWIQRIQPYLLYPY